MKARRILRLVWMAVGLSITAWMFAGFQSTGVPAGTLRSDGRVMVEALGDGWRFRPTGGAARAGLLFLPGGMVKPEAYAPLLRGLAEAGYEARLIALPWRCACTDEQVKTLFDTVTAEARPGVRWVLGGHSRGAMLATRFAHERGTAALAGLALLGTTHPRDFSLTDLNIPVVKVYGTNDGVASYAKMRANAGLLPAATKWVAIEGGNHVQFGYYRHQFGDEAAAISRAEQQARVKAALMTFLAGLGG